MGMVGEGKPSQELGHIYKTVLHQRGYGFGQRPGNARFYLTNGFGWSEALAKVFTFAKPLLEKGMQYLGQKAFGTVANIAQDALNGENILGATKKHVTDTAEDIFAQAPGAIMSSVLKRAGLKRKRIIQQSSGQLVTSARRAKRQRRAVGNGLHQKYPALDKI